MPQTYVKDGGVWKPATVFVKSGGVWLEADPHVRDAGVWKEAFVSVTVTVSPTSRYATSTMSNSMNFPACTVSVTGGTASSYTWSLSGQEGGIWSIWSGQGTASAAARVTNAQSYVVCQAYLVCAVVVNGQTYYVSVPHSFEYYGGGGPGGPIDY